MVPLCLKFGAIPTIIYKVTAFWKKWHMSFFFDRPPSWKCQSNHTGFQTYPSSPKWKMADPRNFGPFLSSYRVNIARCNLCARAKVKGHIKLKNRRKHFRGKIGRAISNLVAVLVSDLWVMAGKNGTVFFNNWPPTWMCHSDRTGCWPWVSPHRKEAISLISAQFYHMPGRYERVCVGWHCAKVKGHAELKIEKSRVTTFIYDFPKLHHSSPNSFGANVHLHKKIWLHAFDCFYIRTTRLYLGGGPGVPPPNNKK